MAEALAAIGIIASIAQLADYGFKLSVKLYTFAEAVSSADRSIGAISNDVSLISTVLRELSEILKADDAHYVSERAVEATEQTVKDCFVVFEELSGALDRSLKSSAPASGKDGKAKVRSNRAVLEKLKWPFLQPKMELLRSNLDRFKASLTLMLQVLSYARDLSRRQDTEQQKQIIEGVARAERETRAKYEALKRLLQQSEAPPAYDKPIISMATGTREVTTGSDPEQEVLDQSFDPSKPLIGELILSFNLVHNALSSHIGVAKDPLQYKDYFKLRRTIEAAHDNELERLERSYGDAAFTLGAEAAKNAVQLQKRLRELAHGLLAIRTTSREHSKLPRTTDQDNKAAFKTDATTAASQEVKNMMSDVDTENNGPIDFAEFAAIVEDNGTELDSATVPTGANRTAALQAEVDDTVRVMRENINRVSERRERLDALEDKTDNLAVSAQGFRRSANRVRRQQYTISGALGSVGTGVNEAYKAMQEWSHSVYETGSSLLHSPESPSTAQGLPQDAVDDASCYGQAVKFFGGGTPFEAGKREDTTEDDEDLAEELLAQWTNLQGFRRRSSTSQELSAFAIGEDEEVARARVDESAMLH